MNVLVLDASTSNGSIAVLRGGDVRARRSIRMRSGEPAGLMTAIDQALHDAGIVVRAIDRLICGAGPGSFTSLRIAAATAKGLAIGLNRPLFAVPSLGLLVGGAAVPAGRYVPTLDALRGEWHAAVYVRSTEGQVRELEPPCLLDRAGVEEVARAHGARPLGGIDPGSTDLVDASAVVSLRDWLAGAQPVDVATWQPDYGRLAEAQVKWEAAHGRALDSTGL